MSSPNYASAFADTNQLRPLLEALGAKDGSRAFRQGALERAAKLGFPTVSQEEWRYTSLEPVASLPFKPLPPTAPALPSAEQIAPFLAGGETARRLVFVDGVYAPSLSRLGSPLAGLHLSTLAQSGAQALGALDRCAGGYENFMGALNSAFFSDGAYLTVAKSVQVTEVIQLLFVRTKAGLGLAQQPRNVILAEANAQVAVVETYVSLSDGPQVTNTLTEIQAAEGAQVEHIRLQNESLEAFHFGAVHAHLGRSSKLLSHVFSLGSRLARQDIRAVFSDEGGYALFNGLYLTQGTQLTDHHTLVDHAKPHCESHEFYHGILEDSSKAVFNGKIVVRPDAQKTDAKQTNRNLLLSNKATIDTKPQLEIFADDVKCTHGATVGQLDEDSLFYLQARGIGAQEARRMLIHAFARAAILRVGAEAVRPSLDQWVLAKLGGGKEEHE